MYFNESEALIKLHPSDHQDLTVLDRNIARSYSDSGFGFFELGPLRVRAGLQAARVSTLLALFEGQGVVELYQPLQCPCGEKYDPAQGDCPACSTATMLATPASPDRWRVVVQPQQPMFNPSASAGPYNVFLSYRHGTAAKLAADLFYSLTGEGKKVFLDDDQLPPGVSSDRVFLQAASQSPLFIALVTLDYWESLYCKRELAHALRAGQRVVLVTVDGGSPIPTDMPWLAAMTSGAPQGSASGLGRDLERYVHNIVATGVRFSAVNDYRVRACSFLMFDLSDDELEALKNQFDWTRRVSWSGGPDAKIGSILNAVGRDPTHTQELCAALAPT